MAKRKTDGLNGVADLYALRQLAEKNLAPDDDGFRQQYPKLFSILSDQKVSETQLIDPPTLTLRNAAGDWQLSLSVPGLRMYRDVLGSTFQDALQRLETDLANNPAGWRVNTKKPVSLRELKKQK